MTITTKQLAAEVARRARLKNDPRRASTRPQGALWAELKQLDNEQLAAALAAAQAPAKKAPAKKAAKVADPAKKAAAQIANAVDPTHSTAWWVAYRGARACQSEGVQFDGSYVPLVELALV